MKKIFIIGLMVCALLLVSAGSVSAKVGPIPVTDETGDVMDEMGETATSSGNIDIGNIDITETTYSRDGDTITLTLTVGGSIEDRGNIDDLEGILEREIDLVMYALALTTADNEYLITYVNGRCELTHWTIAEPEDVPFSIDGDGTLAVSFDRAFENDSTESLTATATYMRIPVMSEDMDWEDFLDLDFEELIDEASGGITDENADGDGTSNSDENGNAKEQVSDGSKLLLFVGLVATISIAGIGMVTYLILKRR